MRWKNRIGGQRAEFVGLLLVLLVPLLVFLQVGWYEFLGYDDPINIYQNPHVVDFSLANLRYFWQGPSLGLYIPVTYNVWMVLAKLSQLLSLGGGSEPANPHLYHLANLLVHLSGTALVYLIIRDLLNNGRAAMVGALLFAIHPVQVEPVAWASGMKDLLGGFWSLLAVRQYILFCRATARPRRVRHYLLAILALLLALLAKPSAVVVPLLAGLLGWLVLERRWSRVLVELSPWLLCVVPAVLVTTRAQTLAEQVYQPGIWQRFLVAGDAISFYLYKLLLPVNLGPDYGRLPELVLGQGWAYLTGAVPFLLAIYLLWQAPRAWLAAFGLFVAALLPVLGLRPFAFQEVSTVADRYLYLAMLGPALAAGYLWSQHQGSRIFRVIVVVSLTLLAAQSTRQARFWENPLVFSKHALKVNPRSWNSFLRYGIAEYQAGHQEEAVKAFRQALAIKPDFPDALYGLGIVYWERGQSDQALALFNKILVLDPVNVPAALALGDIYRKDGRYDLAIGYYLIAVDSELDRAEFHVSLGECYAGLGRDTEAIASFQQAIAMQPDYAEAYSRLGAIYQKRREYDKAVAILQKLKAY